MKTAVMANLRVAAGADSTPCRHCGAAVFDPLPEHLPERCRNCDGAIQWLRIPRAQGRYFRGFCNDCIHVYELRD